MGTHHRLTGWEPNSGFDEMPSLLEEFRGKHVLVVEDDYLLAQDIGEQLEDSQAVVVGPVGSVNDALALIEQRRIDVAILDVMLDTETSFPIANALLARDIPFVFATGQRLDALPDNFRGFALAKPTGLQAIGQKLFGDRPH